MELTIARGPNG